MGRSEDKSLLSSLMKWEKEEKWLFREKNRKRAKKAFMDLFSENHT